MLERRSVEDDIDVLHRAQQSWRVANVADQIVDVCPVPVLLPQGRLLCVVAAIYPHDTRLERQYLGEYPAADGTGPTQQQDRLVLEDVVHTSSIIISLIFGPRCSGGLYRKPRMKARRGRRGLYVEPTDLHYSLGFG